MFSYKTVVNLHDTDAAGLLFFSNQFKLIHDAYEILLESVGFSFAELIQGKNYFLPIVHAESTYKKPLFVGDRIAIQVTVENIGNTSFTLSYTILNDGQETVGTAKTTHVTMDKKAKTKIAIPDELREALQKVD